MRTGGRIVAAARHVSDLGDPQMDDPAAESLITVAGGAGQVWRIAEAGPYGDGARHPWNRGIDLELLAGVAPAGQTIAIHLGDPGGGCPGYRCQSFAEKRFGFRLGVLPAPGEPWRVEPESESAGAEIVGGAAVGLRVVVTQPTKRGAPRRVTIKPEDAYGNVAGPPAGTVRLLLDEAVPLADVDCQGGRAEEVVLDLPADEGVRRLTAAGDDGRLFARSNPFGSSPVEGMDLFWGEIHAQSGLCDGTNDPADLYDYARNAAGLDFAAVTSHDFELTDDDWRRIRQATRDAHRPGRFVTFLGYEWSGGSAKGGDNNVYFLGDDGPLLYCNPFGGYPEWDPSCGATAGADRTVSDLADALRRRGAMIVPHCGGRRCNLDFHDGNLMPMIEIHSCHRTYEDVAFEAIGRGLRVGFIGGSDDHRGAIGDSRPAARERYFSARSGLVGAWAKRLTREALWEAFFARRVYATNGPRIVLDVRARDDETGDGVFMGGELRTRPGRRVTLRFVTWLDGLLGRIVLLEGDRVIRRFDPPANQVPQFQAEHAIEVEPGRHAFWLRVRQSDGGTAWSSPIWIVA